MRVVSIGLRPWSWLKVGLLRMAAQRPRRRLMDGATNPPLVLNALRSTRAAEPIERVSNDVKALIAGAPCVSQTIVGHRGSGAVAADSVVSPVRSIRPSWTDATPAASGGPDSSWWFNVVIM